MVFTSERVPRNARAIHEGNPPSTPSSFTQRRVLIYYAAVDPRILILTIPSIAVLALLFVHSRRVLPGRVAAAYWCGVAAYGVVRGVALKWVIDRTPGASIPYVIKSPLFAVASVSFQEIAGWAIVAYLGWWLGSRLSRYLFARIAWACLFLGTISWAVESAAVAAGWWRWTVPAAQPILLDVPKTALIDWFFVGTDFLLPLAVLVSPELRSRRSRYLALLSFPIHFASHALAGTSLPGTAIPAHHFVHWILLGLLLWLTMRSPVTDEMFAGESSPRAAAWLPLAALAIVLADAGAVDLWIGKRPVLVLTIIPAAALGIQAVRPKAGYAIAAASLLGALLNPASLFGAVPAAFASLSAWGRKRAWVSAVCVVAMAIGAILIHQTGARADADISRRLSHALGARDRGDIDGAERELHAIAADFPGSHVPLVFLGEIAYRTGKLDEARTDLSRAVEIKPDFAKGYRYLAVIGLRLGDKAGAARYADRGLELAKDDVELRFLAARAHDRAPEISSLELASPQTAETLAAIAFEVGDDAGAAEILDRALRVWPDQRSFYGSRVKIALQRGDVADARRVAEAWASRFPMDGEARSLLDKLEKKREPGTAAGRPSPVPSQGR